jgi:hypothetical protein
MWIISTGFSGRDHRLVELPFLRADLRRSPCNVAFDRSGDCEVMDTRRFWPISYMHSFEKIWEQ